MDYFFENGGDVFVVANCAKRRNSRDVMITLPLNHSMQRSYHVLKNKGMSQQLIFEYLFPNMSKVYYPPVMVQMNIADLNERQLTDLLRKELKTISNQIHDLPLHNMREILSAILNAQYN
jgi:hypothetical protein